MTATTTLTSFLLARIADDEAWATEASRCRDQPLVQLRLQREADARPLSRNRTVGVLLHAAEAHRPVPVGTPNPDMEFME